MFKKITCVTILFTLGIIFGFISCEQNVPVEISSPKQQDLVPPDDVKYFTAERGNSSVLLSWVNPDDTDLKGVEISMVPPEQALPAPILLENTQSFLVSGLQNGKEYKFSIKSVDESLNRGKEFIKFQTPIDDSDKTPPSNPTDFFITNSNGNAVLYWTNPNDSDFYAVEVSCNPPTGTLQNPIILTNQQTSLSVAGFTIGRDYTLFVKSIDKSFNKSNGAYRSMYATSSKDTTAPGTPQSLSISTQDKGRVLVSWRNPSDADFYGVEIYSSPAEGFLQNPIIIKGNRNETQTQLISGLDNYSSYTIILKSLDNSLNKSNSTSRTVYLDNSVDTTPPNQVYNLRGTASNGNVLLNWQNPYDYDDDFYGVEISCSPAEGTLNNPVIIKGSSYENKSFLVSGLQNNIEYEFVVKTLDNLFNKSYGTAVYKTPIDDSDKTPPNDPYLNYSNAKDGSVTLSWTNPTNDDFFAVEISVDSNEGSLENPIIIEGNPDEEKTLLVSGLTSDMYHNFTIKSIDKSLNVNSGYSRSIFISDSTDITAPNDVSSLRAINRDKSVLLTWYEPYNTTDVFGYEVTWNKEKIINRSATSTPMKENSLILPKGSTYCYISNLKNGENYTFTVKTIDTSGNISSGQQISITPSIISLNPIRMYYNFSNSSYYTNEDITITVNPTVDDRRQIKAIKYKEGLFVDAKTLLEDENSFDITQERQIVVSQNGTYSIAVLVSDEYCEIFCINITEIDRIKPEPVKNLQAKFDYEKKQILVNWNKQTNINDHYTDIEYKVDGVTYGPFTKNYNQSQDYIIDIEDENFDGKEYEIIAKLRDFAGNVSDESNVLVTTKKTSVIKSIELNRNHISDSDSNREIEVTINGVNFDMIKFESNPKIKVRFTDSNNNTLGDVQEANIDEVNNKATVTMNFFTNGASTNGTDIFVVVSCCGIDCLEKAKFKSSSSAGISSVELGTDRIKLEEVGTDSTVKVTLRGTNLDLLDGDITMEFHNSNNELVGEKVIIEKPEYIYGNYDYTFYQEIKIPQIEDTYTLYVKVNDTTLNSKKTLFVYGNPKGDSFTIPTAGSSASGKTVNAVLKGLNFVTPDFDKDKLSLSCTEREIIEGATFDVINNKTILIPLTIIGTVGNHTVTVNYDGSELTSGTFTIKDYSSVYTIGDVILKDGEVISYDEEYEFSEEDKNNAVAVICGYTNGVPIGIGLKESIEKKSFSNQSKNINKILSSYTGTSPNYSFTGDVDGSDNWEEICRYTLESETNYSAFNFALTYSEIATNLIDSDYEKGWYIPTIAEQNEIYKNLLKVNNILQKIGTEIGNNVKYWSSSQSSNSSSYACYTIFSPLYSISYTTKASSCNIRVIRKFE